MLSDVCMILADGKVSPELLLMLTTQLKGESTFAAFGVNTSEIEVDPIGLTFENGVFTVRYLWNLCSDKVSLKVH